MPPRVRSLVPASSCETVQPIETNGREAHAALSEDDAVFLTQAAAETTPNQQCVVALVYTYDHTMREVSKRLTETFHHHHDMSVSTLHVHLDQDQCMEVTVLKGLTSEVRHFADHVIARLTRR